VRGVVINGTRLDTQRSVQLGRQAALADSAEVIEQLVTQLCAARAELREARAEFAARIEATREYFDREARALREMLASAQEDVERLNAVIELGSLDRTRRLN
jgi:hypothetical protein